MSTLPLEPPPKDLCFGEVQLRFVRIVPEDDSSGLVPAYRFRIVVSGRDVGHINFKVGDTDHILLSAGHIGFAVDGPFRGRGYALQACQALAPFVRRFYASVVITTDPDNVASIQTIERLGAEYVDEVPVPDRDPQFRRGSRRKRRYRWSP